MAWHNPGLHGSPGGRMKFLLLIYTDDTLLEALPAGAFDQMMHGCITHADELKAQGTLLESQQLEHGSTARTVRVRDGKTHVVDGPFAETKEILGGYNLIEADSLAEAVKIAQEFPWIGTGSIEVRPVRDFEAVRRRVGA
jgi:hypothetical protein